MKVRELAHINLCIKVNPLKNNNILDIVYNMYIFTLHY